MTQAQWMSLLRSLGLFLGGILVSRGVISATALSDLIDQIIKAAPLVVETASTVVPIAASLWGLWVHSVHGTVAAAAATPGVDKVVTTSALAAASNNPKVVSTAQNAK